jgi:transcriptional regulator with XRE-family HTH domain
MNGIADTIRRLREDDAYSQIQFGEVYGVTGQAISLWEQGRATPMFSTWMRIAKRGKVPEGRAVTLWARAQVPEEYQHYVSVEGG